MIDLLIFSLLSLWLVLCSGCLYLHLSDLYQSGDEVELPVIFEGHAAELYREGGIALALVPRPRPMTLEQQPNPGWIQ